jgi:hypothetical protein
MIGCASEAHEGEGYVGTAIKWRVFVRESKSIRRRLTAQSPEGAARIEAIARAIRATLENEGIQAALTEA